MHRRPAILGAVVVLSAMGLAGSAGYSGALKGAPASIAPNPVGNLDCNGFSAAQQPIRLNNLCTDIAGVASEYGGNGHFYDNGHYIGHDEPSIRYLSSTPGSGNNVDWNMTLGSDPAGAPTVSSPGHDITHTVELTPAPWFSMAMCDPNSYPQGPCTPGSDANAPSRSPYFPYPGAGSAFMEMQFYPPGFAPFVDGPSCDNTHYCAALNIDSFEALAGPGGSFLDINPNCTEPINFSFIQTDGVPPGPPSPQLTNLATLSPNGKTLLMNPGDSIAVHMADAPAVGGNAFKVVINDLTTGASGFMQASAANGFTNTNLTTCAGTPFNFEPEYSTASVGNIIPWAANQVNISMAFETGHFIPCTSLSDPATLQFGSFTDTYYQTCAGPYEDSAPGGDGGSSPEVSDAYCFYAGDTHGGTVPPNVVTGCEDNLAQNGDLDFDGTPYWPDWPTSTTPNNFPSTFVVGTPVTNGGLTYSQFQFQTDAALSETSCAPTSLSGCAVPPPQAPGRFYPYWTQVVSSGRSGQTCVWEFGNMTNGNTYGGARQYGTQQFRALGYPQIISGAHTNNCR